MIDWQQFHFLRPLWFTAILPLALLLWFLLRHRQGSRWEAVCDAALLPFILLGARDRPSRGSLLLLLTGGLLAITALAGPTWSRLPQPVFSSQTALVVALDLSRSMDAADISPSRLARARFKIADLLRQRQEGQTALLVYAGDSFTVTPLTDDSATILSQLPAVTTDIMPIPGSRTDLALERAGELLRQAGRSHGDVLLITDEVDEVRASSKARSLHSHGYRVSVLGVGTEQGAPIPLLQGGFLKDDRGEIVIPALEEAPMRDLARDGGGTYVRMALDDSDLATLGRQFTLQVESGDTAETELKTDVWEEQGPWLLLALLPLAALAFRRGYVVVLLFMLMPIPRPASAMEWNDLWLRPDQQGKHALDAGDAAGAAKLFHDPGWQGAAHYRAGEYDAAAAALDGKKDADGFYNKGNALARLGRFPEAIAAYDEALKQNPADADAKFNKELLEKEMQKQQQQPQQDAQQGGQPDKPQDGDSKQQADGSQDQKNESGDQSQDQNQQGQPKSDAQQAQDHNAQPSAEQEQDAKQDESENKAKQADSEKPGDQDEKSAQAAEDAKKQAEEKEKAKAIASADPLAPDEEQQAAEQWLRRIPDDPGGLLRRKFLYQYRQRHAQAQPGEKSW